jgi:hypothetical protein
MLKNIAILAFVTLASPALANGLPHTQDEWFVNSGRYVNGSVPSYETQGSFYMTTNTPRLIERRNSGYIAHGSSHGGHDAVVQALGN